jgi:CBS domain-containing protein
VPVIEPGNHLVGIVSEFDVLKALAKGQDLQALKAEDIMTSQPVTVEETATAEMVINQMIEHQIIRIPVVRDDRLVGMISRTDLMNQLIDSHLINVYGG